jgi:hypothetical protein
MLRICVYCILASLRITRLGSWKMDPSFLRRFYHNCSLTSSSSSSRLVYIFIKRALRVVAFNTNSVRPIVVVKKPQVTYDFSSQIMFYILNVLICVCMILLDNLL